MPLLRLDYDTGNVPIARVVHGVAIANGWTETIPDPQTGQPIPNPVSKQDFARLAVRKFMVDCVKSTELEEARIAVVNTIQPIILT